MDKYRKVEKPKDAIVKDDDEIRVTAMGSISAYVVRAAKVFNELEKPQVVIKATGNALTKAVTLAEVVKRRFKGLHQITELNSTEIVDEYEPLEEGLDKVTDTRTVSVIEIKLSKEPLDTSDKGYQAPLEESLVKEFDPEQMAKPRGRGRGAGKGKGKGKGKDGPPSAAKPSNVRMLKAGKPRLYTVSVALPASIIENAQSGELKAVLVGQVARALTIFSVDEVVLYEDRSDATPSRDSEGLSRGLAFFVRNLQHLEMPQYLRRQLLPVHGDLRWVGLLSPLDAPHHLRRYERLIYREGAVLPAEKCPKPPEGEEGCWVNCGLEEPVWVAGEAIPSGVRVTVQLDQEATEGEQRRGRAVAPEEPRTKLGLYWGYQVRIAASLRAVFDECPFEGGYDFSIGTSERGEPKGMAGLPKFQHLLLAFGGLGGLEEAVDDELSGYPAGTDAASLFNRYVNICPRQTSRTIRTEEALLIALAALSPHLGKSG